VAVKWVDISVEENKSGLTFASLGWSWKMLY